MARRTQQKDMEAARRYDCTRAGLPRPCAHKYCVWTNSLGPSPSACNVVGGGNSTIPCLSPALARIGAASRDRHLARDYHACPKIYRISPSGISSDYRQPLSNRHHVRHTHTEHWPYILTSHEGFSSAVLPPAPSVPRPPRRIWSSRAPLLLSHPRRSVQGSNSGQLPLSKGDSLAMRCPKPTRLRLLPQKPPRTLPRQQQRRLSRIT